MTKVEELHDQLKITLNPNPTIGKLVISSQLGFNDLEKIVIFNSAGGKVKELDLDLRNLSNSIEINMTNYTAGIYFINLTSLNNVITKSFIKYD